MVTALVVSTVFMVSYLTYHAEVGYTPFTGQGIIRPFYFTLLASHVILAAIIVPMVLATVFYALRGNFNIHPRILGFHVYTPEIPL